MNKSYRSLWNESLGAWVAASEVTASRSKKSGTSAVALMLATLIVSGYAGGVAAQQVGGGTTTSPGSTAISPTTAECANDPLVGTSAQFQPAAAARGNTSMAIGCGSSTSAGYFGNIAIGPGSSTVLGSGQFVLGFNARGQGNNAIAIGAGVGAGADSVSVGGNSTSSRNVLVGVGTTTAVTGGLPAGPDNVAIGYFAAALGVEGGTAIGSRARVTANGAVALGQNSVASNANAVALGTNSVTGASASVADGTVFGSNGTGHLYGGFAGSGNVVGVVSVGGSGGATRQITNVAPGALTATSTDAVNGSQLYAVSRGLNDRIDGFSAGPGQGGPGPAAPSGIAMNPTAYVAPSATGQDATAVGSGAMATGTNSVALGSKSFDEGRANVVSVGSAGSERQVTNVAAGVQGTDAVNVNQLNSATAGAHSRISAVADQLNSNTKMLSGGIAASAALAVVTPVEPGRFHVSGAVAGYNGQAGIGFNVLKRSKDGQTTLHAGLGWGSGGSKAIVRVGFGFSFD